MSERPPSDLLDELLGQEEPSAAEEDDSVEEEEAAPRRRWWRRRRQKPAADTEPASEAADAEPPSEAAEAEPGSEEADADRPPSARRRKGRHLLDGEAAEVPETAGSGPGSRGPVLPLGPRGAARRRRSRQRLLVAVVGALLALAAAFTLLTPPFAADEARPQSSTAAPVAPTTDQIRTLLLFGVKDKDASAAAWMALLSVNSDAEEGSVIYVPAHTAAEVPGRGLLGLGESLGSGGSDLLEVTTETLLGIQVDARMKLTEEGARGLFEGFGEVTVDVPSELRVPVSENEARVLIPSGPQVLAPDELVSLLFWPGIGGDDAELGSRHLAFWSGLLDRYASDPEGLGRAVTETRPPLGGRGATARIGAILSELAQLPPGARTLANLPVREVSVGGNALYQTESEELATFMEETVGATDLGTDVSEVQVLNGNGVPGIGAEVADQLVGNGYRIALSGNADRLDYYWTRIVSYDDSPEGIAAARRARSLLGTGKVQISSQGQGIVDLTIVVGRDFLRTR